MIMLRGSPSSDSSSQRTLITPYRSGTGTPEEEEELALLQRLEHGGQYQEPPRQQPEPQRQQQAPAAEALPELPSQPSSSWRRSWEMEPAAEPSAKMPVQSWPPGLQRQHQHLPPQPGWDEEAAADTLPWHATGGDARRAPPRAGGQVLAVPGWAVGAGQPQSKQAWTSADADAGLQPLERAPLLPPRSGPRAVDTPAAQTLDAPVQAPGTGPAAPKAPAGAGAGTPAEVPLPPPPGAIGQSQTGGPPRPKPVVDLTPLTQGKNPLFLKDHYDAKTPFEEKMLLRLLILSLEAPPGEELPLPIAHLQHWLNVEGRGPADTEGPLNIPFSKLQQFGVVKKGGDQLLQYFASHPDKKILGEKSMFDWLRAQHPNNPGASMAAHVPVPNTHWDKLVSGRADGLAGFFGYAQPGSEEFFYGLGDATLTGTSTDLRGFVHPNDAAAMQGDITYTLKDRYDWNKNQGVSIPISMEMIRKYLPKGAQVIPPNSGVLQVDDAFFHDLERMGLGRSFDIRSVSPPFRYEFNQARPGDKPTYKPIPHQEQPPVPQPPPLGLRGRGQSVKNSA